MQRESSRITKVPSGLSDLVRRIDVPRAVTRSGIETATRHGFEVGAVLEAPAVVAGFDDRAMM